MLNEVKRLMINQCGPVLMGIKPAALFPLRSARCLDCLSALLPQHINLLVLRETGTPSGAEGAESSARGFPSEGRPLILLYEKTMLEQTLSGGAARGFLSNFGYPATIFSMPSILRYLKMRFSAGNFPHEIGLFLGYPLEDVTGFIRHKGQNYKLCGYWKVYGDVEGAKRLFRQYDLCRECMKKRTEVYNTIDS
jgi:hypothetical protein